jgi:Putative transmembrane protein (PGPGW)
MGDLEDGTRTGSPTASGPDRPGQRYGDRGVLVGADEDRWAWRARIKRNPVTRRVYRVTVGVVGVLLVLLAGATGWLPGPGGIPLALLGLAVLASEFEWAARLLDRVKEWLITGAGWARRQPAWVRRLGLLAILTAVLLVVYGYLWFLGVPSWLPSGPRDVLRGVPGLG